MSHTKDFNALPFDVRKICSRVMMDYQLRDLRIEKARIKSAYRRHMKEVDAHIKNVEMAIRDHDNEPSP